MKTTLVFAFSIMVFSGCGRPELDADGCTAPYPLSATPVGNCQATVDSLPYFGRSHLDSKYDNNHYQVVYSCTNPPASGDHFAEWGKWMKHDQPLPRSHYVHNLEHGGVALLYNCAALPAGTNCADVVAGLQAIVAAQPRDPICTDPINARLLITADPLLDVPVAAAAWQVIYRAHCFDATTLTAFVNDNYAHGVEDLCTQGQVPAK
jgi:hypothetical protein